MRRGIEPEVLSLLKRGRRDQEAEEGKAARNYEAAKADPSLKDTIERARVFARVWVNEGTNAAALIRLKRLIEGNPGWHAVASNYLSLYHVLFPGKAKLFNEAMAFWHGRGSNDRPPVFYQAFAEAAWELWKQAEAEMAS